MFNPLLNDGQSTNIMIKNDVLIALQKIILVDVMLYSFIVYKNIKVNDFYNTHSSSFIQIFIWRLANNI